MSKKYILLKGEIRAGEVDMHKHLLNEKETKEDVKGGGWFDHNLEKREVTFYSLSSDYGPVKQQDLISTLEVGVIPDQWKAHKFYFISWTERPESAGNPSNIMHLRERLNLHHD